MARRGRIDIYADLIGVAREPCRKTRLVYQGNLNFVMITPIIRELVKKGLLKQDGSKYEATKKGLEYIKAYEHVKL